ncbi:tetratricopeptide (TPR) repeat protein [Arcicella rosea]|uniref:hypothetical protein n=1 Tax=Arcicella rosea TaxID=502909 RepID=UPI00345DA83D
MGIFDFLKLNKVNSATTVYKLHNNKFDEELEELKQKNKAWEESFKHIITLREKAKQFEQTQQYQKAIEIYLESIDFGKKSDILNFANYGHDIERVIILYSKTKQVEKEIEFLNNVIYTYPNSQDLGLWRVRLSKLTNNLSNQTSYDLKYNEIIRPINKNITIGKELNNLKKSLPEFNFYFDMPSDMQTFEYIAIHRPVSLNKSKELKVLKEKFDLILTNAQLAENSGDLKTAIEFYLELIAEDYEGKEPFERLLIIYKKLKWKEQEYEILLKAIDFFESLKAKQRRDVITLAQKYKMEGKALEYINSNKKIQYFGGAFDLYNPYPILEKWKEKLNKF